MVQDSNKNRLLRFLYKIKRCFVKSVSNTADTLQMCVEAALKKISLDGISVKVLHWRDIIEWFQQWMNKTENTYKDVIGFTIRESAETGNYIMIQGVFNKTDSRVEDARRITAEDADEEVKYNCFREKVTLFT